MKEGEEFSQRTYMHIHIAYGHKQQCGKVRGGGWAEAGWRWAKGGRTGDIYNNVNNKKISMGHIIQGNEEIFELLKSYSYIFVRWAKKCFLCAAKF